MTPELHLIVLWANARYKQYEILEDVKKSVEIKAAYDIQWSKDKVADNFTRFYGVFLPDKSGKEKECGTGSFLVLAVLDKEPKYGYIETSRGTEKVNLNIFDLKQKYRSWTGGGHKVHTTNTVEEVNHDAALLLGKNYEDLLKLCEGAWNGEIVSMNRDVTGVQGWQSLNELFYTLNATINYVVLRGFEDFDATLNSAEHGDIDMMVDHYDNAAWIVGGEKHFTKRRPHYLINVGDKKVYIDLWDIQNDYHDRKWDEAVLEQAEKNEVSSGVVASIPCLEHYFYLMIYHVLIHKKEVASDYYGKIYDLFVKLGLDKQYDLSQYESPFDLYFLLLEKYMAEHNYSFVKPKDKAIFYSEKLTKIAGLRKYFQKNFSFSEVNPVHTDMISRAYNIFLSAKDENGEKLFIKVCEDPKLCRNEYQQGAALYQTDNVHFVKPVYWRDNLDATDVRFYAGQYISAPSLKDLVVQGKLKTEQKTAMIADIEAIFAALQKSDVVHRDVSPSNLLYYQNHLVLIDFQLAVSKTHYKELKFLKSHPKLLRALGTSDYRQVVYCWDDAYSLLKVLEFIGVEDAYAAQYQALYQKISDYVGQAAICYFARKDKPRLIGKFCWYCLKSLVPVSAERRQKYKNVRQELKQILRHIK